MKTTISATVRVWCGGIILLGLRLIQNQTGFDPSTGLSLPSVAGTALPIALAVLAAQELLLARKGSREKPSFDSHFAPPERSLTALVMGCLLLVAGGLLLLMGAFAAGSDIPSIVTGVLAVLTGFGFLALGRQMRAWDELNLLFVLPSLFLGVFLVLAVYLPAASDPVLARYYLQVLAAALAAYAFGQLAGFLRRESTPRTFTVVGDLAVMTSIAAIADGGMAMRLLFAGCAVVLSVFLALQRSQPLAESVPAPGSEDAA